jgi:aryl-alcohol dehydrogenase-like predicted oxidoreductase
MRKPIHYLTRRTVVGSLAGLGAAAALPAFAQGAAAGPILKKAIPKTGEQIPAIGMGTWITFNVGNDAGLLAKRAQVMQTFFDRGGGLIDSSPMYGSSEATVGYGLARIKNKGGLVSASKVWTLFGPMGPGQMEASRKYWGIERFDLMQIHNILNWTAHIETLKAMKAEGRARYIGITTSQGWRHGDFEAIMRKEPIDFVAFTYNVIDRKAEERLLPLAADRGIAVIINRPFQEGVLIDRMKLHPLPPWAGEIDCANWAQFLLKFIVSHPAVTCAIPATRRVDHMEENMGALHGAMPDAKMRGRMARYAEHL